MRESAVMNSRTRKSRARRRTVPILPLLLLFLFVAPLRGQETVPDSAEAAREIPSEPSSSETSESGSGKSLFGFTGSATLSGDLYRYSGDTAGFYPRRPANLVRLVVNTELRIGDFFTLPLNLMLSSDETNVVTPWTGQPSFSQYLQNQMNTIGIAPRFGWAQFFLGSHTPQNTGMAFEGSQLFGGGVALQPGRFRFSASAGISQRRIEVDTANGIPGAYEQRAFIGRIGYGDEGGEELAVALTVARVQDDTNSIRRVTQTEFLSLPDTGSLPKLLPIVERHRLMPAAIEGNSTSLKLFVPVAKGLSLQGEAALCNYTRDQLSDQLDEDVPVLGDIATQRVSSRIDYALTAAVGYSRPAFGITAKGVYVGPGFVTPGNPYAVSDKQELTLNPRFALFNGRLNFSGGIGYRINNLSETKADRTTQLIGAATVQAQVTEALSLDASYNNMGISSNNRIDTFRLNNNAQSLSFTPTYVIAGEGSTHAISGQLGIDVYADNNAFAGEANNTTTRTIGGFYSLSLTKIPLTGTLGGSSTLQQASFGDLTINSLSLSLGYRFFNDALRPFFTTSAVQSGTRGIGANGSGTDNRLSFRLGADWRLTQILSLNISASTDFNTYSGGKALQPERQVNEQLVQTALTARF